MAATMDIAATIAKREDSYRALTLILAAWEEAKETGVAPEFMAYAALFQALTDLVTIFGEDAVCTLARDLEDRIEQGEFTIARTLQ
jgi:hypothetical protein